MQSWTLTPEILDAMERNDASLNIPDPQALVGYTNTELFALQLLSQRRMLLRAYKSLMDRYEQEHRETDKAKP